MSTMPYDVPRLTIAVDPGSGRTAVGGRRGRELVNCGVFCPRTQGPSGDAARDLWDPLGEPCDLWNLTQHVVLRDLVDRAAVAAGWIEATYALPGERVRRVVELTSFVAHGKWARYAMLTREVGQLLVQLYGFEPFYTRARLATGERHRRVRGGPYPVESCYPAGIHDEWAAAGAPDVAGRPVAMLPNEDRGRRKTPHKVLRRKCRDAQAVFDLAAMCWMDGHELQALIEGRPLAEVMYEASSR